MNGLALLALMVGCMQQDDTSDVHAVQEWLTKHTGMARPGDLVQRIKLPIAVPNLRTSAFFVHFREFPVQMAPTPPLVQRNVFLVRNGKAEHFKSREALRKSFIAGLPSLSESDLGAVSLDYAVVSAYFSQDGMFQFVVTRKNVSAPGAKAVVTATVPVVEKGGDTGKLEVKLTFAESHGRYKLKAIDEKDTIQPGVRPICQCTLLLHENPVVRKMAERDLLVMGKSAFPYMDQQLKLASPELRREILRVKRRIEAGER